MKSPGWAYNMVDRIDSFRVPEIDSGTSTPLRRGVTKRNEGGSFERVLQEELAFSLHAQKRIRERSLTIDEKTIESLEESVRILEKKGARNSLVVVGDTAFVVNVPQKMVVTCFGRDASRENVFTNIDSAIIL